MIETIPEDAAKTAIRATNKARALDKTGETWAVEGLGFLAVPSATDPLTIYQVTFGDPAPGDLIHFHCTCDAGQHRSFLPVPCWHAATGALMLVEHGLAYVADGLYYRSPSH